jgi:EpsD family peptidyl-prolyl cis-trans isomerase
MTTLNISLVKLAMATGVLLALFGCGPKDSAKTLSQVAARVGDEEISINQINQILSRTPTAPKTAEASRALSQEILEKLIDQELAVQQATEQKIHRSPEVISQLEASRRQILAGAYMQKVLAGLLKPTPLEIKNHYLENPQLFSERRIFIIQEIMVTNSPGITEQLKIFANSGNSIQTASAWLNQQNHKFESGSAMRSAEQIPLDMLTRIQSLKDGQSLVFEGPTSITLLRVDTSERRAVNEATALPLIAQFLTNQRAGEIISANFKKLRSSANITYVGSFNTNETDKPNATAPSITPAELIVSSKSNIDKGLSGLK